MSLLQLIFGSNEAAVAEDPRLGAPLTGPISSNRREELEVEVERLQKRRAVVQSRLLQIGHTREQLETEQQETDRQLEETTASLNNLEDPRAEKMRVARENVNKEEQAVRALTVELEDVVLWYQGKKQELEGRMKEHESQSLHWQKIVRHLEDLDEEEPPPGPRELSFVDTDLWKGISGLVVLVNMLVLIHELVHESSMMEYDLSFLLFYTVELVLCIIYKQKNFFIGKFCVVCWNWLDLFIVTVGVAELLLSTAHRRAATWVVCMRVARVTRLARLIKLVLELMRADPSWARGDVFQSFMMGVIVGNLVVMGFETASPDMTVWYYLDNMFLVVYTFELSMTIRAEGWRFFYERTDHIYWNWFDMAIVSLGILDQWVLPLLKMDEFGVSPKDMSSVMALLRLLRLLRVLRVVSMVKHVPPLYVLIIGVAKAMQGMGWVMLLTMSVLYVCALIAVKLVGEGLALPSGLDPSVEEQVRLTFANIPDATFELFKVMNADLGSLEPFFEAVPFSKYIMAVFMVLTNWALFSILTAVVTDNMASVTARHQAEVAQEQHALKEQRCSAELERIFKDKDQDGEVQTMTEGEFMALMTDEIASNKLCEVTGMTKADLKDVFAIASGPDGGEGIKISKEELVRALDRENRTVTLRSIKKLEQRLQDIEEVLVESGRPAPKRLRKLRSNVL